MTKKAAASKPKEKKSRKAPKWLRAFLIIFAPFRPIGRYVAGSWRELRQVTWPDRKTSIKLTFAVLVFTAVMTGFIVAIDYGFERLVREVIL